LRANFEITAILKIKLSIEIFKQVSLVGGKMNY